MMKKWSSTRKLTSFICPSQTLSIYLLFPSPLTFDCNPFSIPTPLPFPFIGNSHSTKLERADTDDFREREARAHKMAQEISKEKTRHDIDDTGTEEEQYDH